MRRHRGCRRPVSGVGGLVPQKLRWRAFSNEGGREGFPHVRRMIRTPICKPGFLAPVILDQFLSTVGSLCPRIGAVQMAKSYR